jgi:hypothetical protein
MVKTFKNGDKKTTTSKNSIFVIQVIFEIVNISNPSSKALIY